MSSFFRSCSQVDQGLQTGLTPGMKLEVCVRAEADSPYWVANIITTCGQLLLLRYEGYQEDRRADFWCDLMTADLHPLGWSRQHGKTIRPPEGEAMGAVPARNVAKVVIRPEARKVVRRPSFL